MLPRAVVTLATLFIFLGCHPASATICVQEAIQVKRVQGIVLGPEAESIMPGAKLTLSRTGAKFDKVVFSDHEGFFAFPTVPAGTYRLAAELVGFNDYEVEISVRRDAAADQALVLRMSLLIDDCGYTESLSGAEARRVQKAATGG